MTCFQTEYENEDGWTDWIHPLPGYKLACCDCGLVHDMQFRIDDLGQINFRASRNNRSTGQYRRAHKAALKVLRNPENSKAAKTARGEALTSRRKK